MAAPRSNKESRNQVRHDPLAASSHENRRRRRGSPDSQSGARESSAGDEFHYLWATQRALALLDESSRLQLVRIEGFSPSEPVSESADLLLGADVVEYYGGRELATAEQVVVSQLKYSTRHPDRQWTAARLCKASRRGGASVIVRLSQLYSALRRASGHAGAMKKVKLRLVSNQSASDRLLNALAAAQRAAGTRSRRRGAWTVSLDNRSAREIERLRIAAGLDDAGFADFIGLLDLSGCGAGSRLIQQVQLALNVRKHFPGDPESATNKLYRRIQKEGLPEAEGSQGLTANSVLALFGLDSPQSLLPVPTRFEGLMNPIPTEDVAELARAVLGSSTRQLVVHGDAGVGKTTTLTLLESALPSGSIVIPYDCFGAGSYLDPADARHLPEQVATQLVNELSTRCGTPLLLERMTPGASLWRVLRDRIEAAANGMPSGEAVLVIAIDAADNAALAAAEFGEQSFMPQIWHLNVPQNVRLVVTARTHRVPSLAAPDDIPTLSLKGFDPIASATFLRRRFPDASNEECQSFHESSGGNPRVEFYVLDPTRAADSTLTDVLTEANRTPRAILDDLVSAGVRQTSDPSRSTELIANLVAMARPAALATFAEASGISMSEAQRFCHGLAPGIRIIGHRIAFRDEDFEQHLRAIVGAEGERNAHQRLGRYFLAREQSQAEAAEVVAEHLFRGGDHVQLVQLAITRGEPAAIADPIVRLHAYRRRLAFAIRAALGLDARADAFRLTVLAGEAARSGSAVETVIRDRADLAMRHGDPQGVAEIYMRQSNEPWRGPLHFRVAAMYARERNHELSIDHLERARAWFIESRHHAKERGSVWRLSAADIANGAEAHFWNSGGLSAALRWLGQWGPLDARFSALVLLANAVAMTCSAVQLLRELRSNTLQPKAEAAFFAALWNQGTRPSPTRVRALAPRVTQALRRAPIEFEPGYQGPDQTHQWGMHFAELLAASGADSTVVSALLQLVAPPLTEHAPADWDDLARHDLSLRRLALQAALEGRDLTVDDLLPDRLRPRQETSSTGYDRDESTRRQFRDRFGEVLPAYKVRARVVAKRTRVASIAPDVRRQLALRRRDAEHRWATSNVRFPIWSSTITDALLRAQGKAEPLLREIADAAEPCVKGRAPDIWLAMARRLARKPSLEALATELADRAADYADNHEMPATERTTLLLGACAAVDRIDPRTAQDYYNRAVVAAAGVDDDSTKLLRLHARMMVRLAGSNRSSAAAIANRAVRLVESFKLRVSDEDRIPYVETLEAAAELHGPTAFAACSRWDDERRLGFPKSVWPLVRGATAQGYLRVRDGFWLLRLAGERHDISASSLHLMDTLRRQNSSTRREIVWMLNEVARWIERDQPFPARAAAARRIADWAQVAGFAEASGPRRLRELADYAASVGGDHPRDDDSFEWRSRASPKEPIPLATPVDLVDRLDELSNRYGGNSEFEEYVVKSGLAVGPGSRVAFLEALVGVPSTHRAMRWHTAAMVSALDRLLARWRNSTRIATWALKGIPRLVEEHFTGFVAFEESAEASLEAVLRLPFVAQPASLLLRGLASNLNDLRAGQLYAIASAVSSSLSQEDLEDALTWSMSRLDGEDEPRPTGGLSDTEHETVADFVFAVFGSMDRRKRWRAAHAARAIAASHSDFLDALVRRSTKQDAQSFMSEKIPFYWMSARQWLFLTLARIADEQPALMEPHLETLIQAATTRDFPHAAIRHMAKRAAFSIIEKRRITLASSQEVELQMANEPAACLVERKFRYGHGDARQDREGRRFGFDSMDTMPYWFEPLGRVFDRGAHEVADRAEGWIVDRLGFTDKDWWTDQRELSREAQWQEMRNDHGSIPVLETLHSYLEYHAMLLAAGEIVDSGAPIAFDEWISNPSPWQEWLSQHVETFSEFWLSDLRAAAPLEPFVFATLPPEDRWLIVGAPDFDEQLIHKRSDGDEVVVYCDLQIWTQDRHASVRIHSALVEPHTATSLLRALQTATNPHDWRLPSEEHSGMSDGGRFEIDEGKLRLKGLLAEIRQEREGLDKHDPLARIQYAFDRPGLAFQAATGSAPDRSGRILSTRDGKVVSKTLLWHDEIGDERDRIVERHTEGVRTTIPLDVVLDALRHLKAVLIAEVQIDRKIHYRDNQGTERYEPPPTTIYVLRESGTLEGLERRRRLGRSNRPRAGTR